MVVLYIILAIIVILAAVLLLNAARATSKARKLEGQHPTFTEDASLRHRIRERQP